MREHLGIIGETEIDRRAGEYGWTKDERKKEIRKNGDMREQVWLSRLKAWNQDPVLFVCGSCHSETFAATLRDAGHNTVIVKSTYVPDNAFAENLHDI